MPPDSTRLAKSWRDELSTRAERIGRALVGVVIVAVLSVQVIAAFGLRPGPVGKAPFLWPFLSYPMYDQPHYEGDGIPQYRVIAMTADGHSVEIDAQSLGTSYWIFRNAFLFPFVYRGRRRGLEPGVALFERRHGVTLVQVRLENRPILLRRNGSVVGSTEVVGVARRTSTSAPWEWSVQ